MFRYFRDLLHTLRLIEEHLHKLGLCVDKNQYGEHYLNTSKYK